MQRRYLFDEDDYRASRALISRTAANILKPDTHFDFLAPAMIDALVATAREIDDEALERAAALPEEDGAPERPALVDLLEATWRQGRRNPRLATIARNAELLAETLELSDLEREMMFLRLACEADAAFATLADNLRQRLPSVRDTIACLAGADPAEVGRCLDPGAPLRRAGILSLQPDSDTLRRGLALLDLFEVFATERFDSAAAVSTALIGDTLEATLPMQAFEHVGEARLATRVLAGALKAREKGVNVLLYGPPGTGKTELAKTLARDVGTSLFSVGEVDRDGDEPSRFERLRELKLAQHVLSMQGSGICLFDEAEDLFSSGLGPFGMRAGSKVFMNRLFEANPVPVLWIANDIEALSLTVRRRLTLAIKVDMPPAHRRGAILSAIARDAGKHLEQAWVDALVRNAPVAPGVVAKAVQATRLVGGDADTLEIVTRGLAQALRDGDPLPLPRHRDHPPFDPALTCADMDLADLANRLVRTDAAFSLCLHGPSGTGKSAYARHLADRKGMAARVLRGSDLLGPYVGETERAIRSAFDVAARDGQFLILDEVDGLLSARADAHASHELTRVNELLTAMEAHPLPFAVTTNLADRLDPAAHRRIDFHIAFSSLTPNRAAACWRHFLPGEPPKELARLSGLTPAHFDRVRRKAGLMGDRDDPAALLRRLAEEVSPGAREPVGFRARLAG